MIADRNRGVQVLLFFILWGLWFLGVSTCLLCFGLYGIIVSREKYNLLSQSKEK